MDHVDENLPLAVFGWVHYLISYFCEFLRYFPLKETQRFGTKFKAVPTCTIKLKQKQNKISYAISAKPKTENSSAYIRLYICDKTKTKTTPEYLKSCRFIIRRISRKLSPRSVSRNVLAHAGSVLGFALIACDFNFSFCAAGLTGSNTGLVRRSLCPFVTRKRKSAEKNDIGVNVLQGRSNLCVNFQFKNSKIEVTSTACGKLRMSCVAYVNVYLWLACDGAGSRTLGAVL